MSQSRVCLQLVACVFSASCFGGFDGNIDLEKARVAGYSVEYAVALPADYDPEKTYDGIVVVPLGFPTRHNASKTIEVYWSERVENLGFVAVSPVAPRVRVFRDDKFERSGQYFDAFLEEMARRYSIREDRFVLVGATDDALFSLRLAASSPEHIRKVIDLPAFSPDPELVERVYQKLRSPVVLVISDDDREISSDEGIKEFEQRGVVEVFRISAPGILDEGGYAAGLDFIMETGLYE